MLTAASILFGLSCLVLGFFTCFPGLLLRIFDAWTGGNAAGELGGEKRSFLKLTRRLCAVPMLICLGVTVYFGRAALEDARLRPLREQRDAQELEKFRRFGAGSIYGDALREKPKKARAIGTPETKP